MLKRNTPFFKRYNNKFRTECIENGSVQLIIFMINHFEHCNAFHVASRKYKTRFLHVSQKHWCAIKYSKIQKLNVINGERNRKQSNGMTN